MSAGAIPLRSPGSPHRSAYPVAQALSDSDHCAVIPHSPSSPSSTSSLIVNPIQRARSGSRTYSEVQAEERELARRRTRSRERGERLPDEEDLANQDGLSYGELRAEMETLLSLRRRSMSQPLSVDPDLPPTPPATSSPPPSSTASSASASLPPNNPPTSRPKLSLTINTSHLHHHHHPTGGPISPTAPSPAETGTLVRRKSSVSNGKLPSEHPLPPTPPLPLNFPTSPVSVSHFSSESSDSESILASPLYESSPPFDPSSSTSSPSSPSSPYQPNIIRSTSLSSSSSSPTRTQQTQTPTQDLFWLPASLHPELAPQEFKAFIREQTRPEALARRTSLGHNNATGSGMLARGNSRLGPNAGGSARIGGRRNSMLRGEYKPRLNDGVSLDGTAEGGGGGENLVKRGSSLRRTSSQSSQNSGIGGGGGGLAFEELTIRDLQRLEELAARAEREQELKEGEGEGERLGRVLRRSLSLNPHRMAEAAAGVPASSASPTSHSLSSSLPASYGSTLYDHSNSSGHSSSSSSQSTDGASTTATVLDDVGEDYDSPLIVPPPGQILRRNARTKIRKTGPGGEVSFGGYRHGGSGGSRLGGSGRRARSSSDGSNLAGITVGGGDEESASSAGGDSASMDSHEMSEAGGNDLRASTSSIGSANAPVHAPTHSQPIESPPLDGTAQYLEIADPAPPIPHIEVHQPRRTSPTATETPIPVLPPVSTPVSPPPLSTATTAPPPSSTISPASAEYDWASQHLPQSKVAPPAPPASKPSPQYSVHPSHGPSLPPPAPQAVPIPQPERERERSNSMSSISSSKSSSTTGTSGGGAGKEKEVKEKKSGWAAKLGLGSSDDKKKKGKGKDKDHGHSHQNEKSETVMLESSPKESGKSSSKDGGTSNSLFGGLFGRRRNEYDSPSASSSSSHAHSNSSSASNAGTSSALAPPPPPTASGALLPNGRYANFYRLPIHVERAIYRLSHIKLANPRRPLYEQVLISNLMFWYLGLIQKPQPPPPAAPPVPVPGRKNNGNPSSPSLSQSNHASPSSPTTKGGGGAHKPPQNASGGGSVPVRGNSTASVAEMPVKQANFENQGRELNQEHRGERDRHGRYQSPSPNPYPNHNGVGAEYAPLPTGDDDERRKEQDDDDDDDDRPLAEARNRSQSRSPQRLSNPTAPSLSPPSPPPPPSTSTTKNDQLRPTPISTVPKPSESPGFEVTSRRLTPPLGTHNLNLNLSPESSSTMTDKDKSTEVDKRISVLSNKSLSEIYEAYSLSGSPATPAAATGGGGGGGNGSATTTPPRGSSLQGKGTGQ